MASGNHSSQFPFFGAASYSSQERNQSPIENASEGAFPRRDRAGQHTGNPQSSADLTSNFTAWAGQSIATSAWPGYQTQGQWGLFAPGFPAAAIFPQIQFQNQSSSETWPWQQQQQQQYPQYGHINPAFLPQQPVANSQHPASANDTYGYRGFNTGSGTTYDSRYQSLYDYNHRANQISMANSQAQATAEQQRNFQQTSQTHENAISQFQHQGFPASYYTNTNEASFTDFRQNERYDHRFPQLHGLVNPHMMSPQLTPPGENPRQYLLPRPEPSSSYLEQAKLPSRRLSEPKKLLIVLDLNGTLLLRSGRGSKYTPRPRVEEFLTYCLEHHALIVWSSARPHNVKAMVAQLFDPEQHAKLVKVWSRDHLRLGKHFEAKVQVYKQLTWLWEDTEVQASFPSAPFKVEDGWKTPSTAKWDQSNTVLLDDSIEKAASEPYNLIEVDEFTRENVGDGNDVLGRVVAYIEDLKWEADVSAAMRERPFVNGQGEVWNWNTGERRPSA